MNRAMYSGVAGLKTHQYRMDVIGNNIANVNTYGYKTQRAVFSDIFYQTLRGASQGTASRGGTNPSTVGYGSTLGAIQTMMSQSSMQNTGFGLDVAITGEGFLQVMDPDGNIFYTKAGLLDYDSNGYLVDINGNFVLGAADVKGAPNTQKIKLDNMGAVNPGTPSSTHTINGIVYTLTASNADKAGNIGVSFKSAGLPLGLKASAMISNTGSIDITLNAGEVFMSLSELNDAINKAIIEANNGKPHAAGTFTLTMTDDSGANRGDAFGYPPSVTGSKNSDFLGGSYISGLSNNFNGAGALNFLGYVAAATSGGGDSLYVSITTGNGKSYKAEIPLPPGNQLTSGGVYTLEGVDPTKDKGSISIFIPDWTTITTKSPGVLDYDDLFQNFNGLRVITPAPAPGGSTTTATSLLGGAYVTGVSNDFAGEGALTFNGNYDARGIMLLTATAANGKSYTAVLTQSALNSGGNITFKGGAQDGTLTMYIPPMITILENLGTPGTPLSKAEFEADFDKFIGASTHNYTVSAAVTSGGHNLAIGTGLVPIGLTGEQIAVADQSVKPGYIEGFPVAGFNFKGTSTNFVGEGEVTAFSLSYNNVNGVDTWSVIMALGSDIYVGDVPMTAVGSQLLMKGKSGDSFTLTIPAFQAMTDLYKLNNGGFEPEAGSSDVDLMSPALIGATPFAPGNKVVPAEPNRNLGLSSVGFNLGGGTAGGVITLDELSNITIGSDGTVSVSHAEKGTVAVGKVSLANFSNPRGLMQVGSNYYKNTVNSGPPVLADPGSGGTGALKSSALEMSNVDLANEFADMIVTQRGFQANTRIVSVSDQMLEELVNLKR